MKKITIRAPEYVQEKSKKKEESAGVNILELASRSDRIREVLKNKEKSGGICSFCKEETDELVTCAKCGKTGCTSCFTYDAGLNAYFCPDCW